MSISERIRPDIEAAPWVVDEIGKLEASYEALKLRVKEYGLENTKLKLAVMKQRQEASHEIEALRRRVKELEAEVERMTPIALGYTQLAELRKAQGDKRAIFAMIDALMFEYCPEKMTPEQIAEWERHQQAVPNVEVTGAHELCSVCNGTKRVYAGEICKFCEETTEEVSEVEKDCAELPQNTTTRKANA